MHIQPTIMARAILFALSAMSAAALAQDAEPTLGEVVVTSSPFSADEGAQILAPAKVLSGDELRNKLDSSLGETLSHELGVSSSGFGVASSRPVIRGMEGARVKMLQNGMSVSDVSAISNDHAVAASPSTARQIEILRGPAALLYGSGAIGGLVNVVNDRIPTELAPAPTGEAEVRYGSVDKAKSLSLSVDGSSGPFGLHVDGDVRNANDYRIPGLSNPNDPASSSGTLPNSFSRQHSLGFGASFIGSRGYIGASAGTLDHQYGNPTASGSRIDLSQDRYDVDALLRAPLDGFETFRFKLGYTNYRHTELDLANVPETNFTNRALETRWELTHRPLAGWHGTFGVQSENSRFAALDAGSGGPDALPATKSSSVAGFLVEQRDFGALRMNAGMRLESVQRQPEGGLPDRSFSLGSYSVGGLWSFMPGYGLGTTVSIAQRAPATAELYYDGPHEATGTFDRGNPAFTKETSRNIELSLQKTDGSIRWKTNVFQNRVRNYIFGRLTGVLLDVEGLPGGDLNERVFDQANATIRGAEAELSYNARGPGLSLRGFADTSRGTLDNNGNLPLQPATRFGIDAGYQQGAWRSGIAAIRVLRQDRLAASETTTTPAYTQLDANLTFTQRRGNSQITWFALAKNLLNQDIRLSTSVLKDIAPQPGRSLIIGVRTRF
ncbi:MAG: putative outer membrane protein [Herminiimonas sp.]|nr:putative outer membrane protein [Herminiimonas sp.]